MDIRSGGMMGRCKEKPLSAKSAGNFESRTTRTYLPAETLMHSWLLPQLTEPISIRVTSGRLAFSQFTRLRKVYWHLSKICIQVHLYEEAPLALGYFAVFPAARCISSNAFAQQAFTGFLLPGKFTTAVFILGWVCVLSSFHFFNPTWWRKAGQFWNDPKEDVCLQIYAVFLD